MEMFMKEMWARIPEEVEKNLPFSGQVVKKISNDIKFEWAIPSINTERKRILTITADYIAASYALSLRWNEGFWVDGDSFCDHVRLGKQDAHTPHVVIALLGFFKGISTIKWRLRKWPLIKTILVICEERFFPWVSMHMFVYVGTHPKLVVIRDSNVYRQWGDTDCSSYLLCYSFFYRRSKGTRFPYLPNLYNLVFYCDLFTCI